LVLGIAFVISPTKIDSKAFGKRSLFFVIVLAFIVIASLDLSINIFEGVVLIILFVSFLWFNVKQSKHENYVNNEEKNNQPKFWLIIIQFIFSTIAIAYGAIVLVNNVSNISQIMGISEQLIGLSLIALGTNIPEIVTTISSVKKGSPEIGVGNIFGASLINATMLIGGSTLLASDHKISIENYIIFLCLPILFLILLFVTLPIMKNGRSSRLQGTILLFLYFAYSVLMAIFL
jgi:cation:H+ antiporter